MKLNVTKTGFGLTAGPRGAHYSVHSSGRRTRTIGLPGTGLYAQSISTGSGTRSSRPRQGTSAPTQPAPPPDVSTAIPRPGFFASSEDKAYHTGLLAYLGGNLQQSVAAFEQALAADPTIASAHLFAGIAVSSSEPSRAIFHLEAVVTGPHPMPDRLQAKFLADPRLALSLQVKITDSVTAQSGFSPLGAALSLVELYQDGGRRSEAIGLLQQIHQVLPDELIRLSLADLLFADSDFDGVVELSTGVPNDSDVNAELLHLRGAAMMALGHDTAAIEVFRDALAKTAGRDPRLLLAIRYDRGLAYAQLGQRARARADLERVYAADPSFEDVTAQLAAIASPTSGA